MKTGEGRHDALHVSALTVHYGTSPALWDLHLAIPRGHLVGIMGPNGAGKTTFIRAILGFLGPFQGKVSLLGQSLERVRRHIAYIPQRESVDWDFPITVKGLVEMGRYPKRGLFRPLKKEDHLAIEKALNTLNMESFSNTPISQLSGGQQQRAFLARSLAQDADLYFLDEPFSGVDQVSEEIIVSHLTSMVAQGKTVFVIHHDLVTAGSYFDWLILLNTRLVASGPFRKVFTEENIVATFGKRLSLVDEVMKISADYVEGKKVNDAF